jgi:NAD(P)-dependent dehydrogenase (short-subunit alcohol dehydrogenase family)
MPLPRRWRAQSVSRRTPPTRTPLDDTLTFTLERFGRLDILVNNAATNAAYGPLVDQHYETFRKTIDLNVWAPIMWSSLAARAWMSKHRGAIVNTASLCGLVSEPNLGIYNASKAALILQTQTCINYFVWSRRSQRNQAGEDAVAVHQRVTRLTEMDSSDQADEN